jgi:Tfp pilus assembly protein PilV
MKYLIRTLKGRSQRATKRGLTDVATRSRQTSTPKRSLFAQLRSQRGESLVESIVAFAVIAVILIAFAAIMNLGANLTAQTTQLDSDINESMSSTSQTAQYTVTDDSGNQVSGGTVAIKGNTGGVYRYDKS